jgi:hypothetical protein
MTRRKEAEPLTKITIALFTADLERLRALFATAGYNKALRIIVRNYLSDLDNNAAKLVDTTED